MGTKMGTKGGSEAVSWHMVMAPNRIDAQMGIGLHDLTPDSHLRAHAAVVL